MSPTIDGKGKESGTARILGSGTSGMSLHVMFAKICSIFGCWIGVAELLVFHPVDTIAKRLMSNKAKVLLPLRLLSVSAFSPSWLSRTPNTTPRASKNENGKRKNRSPLHRCPLSSSENTPLHPLQNVCYHYSPVSVTQQDIKSPRGYTNMAVNLSLMMSCQNITRLSFRIPLERGRAS